MGHTPVPADRRAPGGSALDVLDAAARASLLGVHAHLAVRHSRIVRYRPDVAPFVTLPPDPLPADWADLAELVGPGAAAMVPGLAADVPPGWEPVDDVPGLQLVGWDVVPAGDAEAVRLGYGEVPEMLALVERTKPGPFLPRTIEMGRYLGIRRDGRLVAMAGERLRPPGWTEISAVCTDQEFRGQGLAARLVLAVAAGIRERGDTPFLHTATTNATAIRLYERLGFRLRRHVRFVALRAPAEPRQSRSAAE
jgi:ribosomal protein S18 acetylase RimI-like enzyme